VCSGSRIVIREIALSDLPQLIDLCAEHAQFERMPYEREGKLDKLRCAFACIPPTLCGWVAESERKLCGYATATVDFSTWNAEYFMHLDCLYVRAAHRGYGLGLGLMQAVVEEARRRGIRELQWQTPAWNTDADRFYKQLGAVARAKLRYTLHLHAMS
jgi:GNAT superfamily N-acetyltransferase